jgi:23S rRNA (adenine2503-C2)-methyltransferase
LKKWKSFAVSIGESAFRGRQLFSWIYARGVSDFNLMTDFSRGLREKMVDLSIISTLKMRDHSVSNNGDTEKFLFELEDGNLIESVLMRYREQKKGRCTVCISTQVGCAQGCVFCASGKSGLVRNLTTGEIIDQVIQIQNYLRKSSGERIHNVVIMGIGEPLMNYDNVIKAIKLLNHDSGIAIGIRRLALSTVGIPKLIRKFADEKTGIRFAVSLHAPDDETRNKIMPVNRKYPLKEILEACRYYQKTTGKRVTFEYMLVEGLNDSDDHAKKLVKVLDGVHAMINIIPLNAVEHFPFRASSVKRCREFSGILEAHGYKAPVRNERGSGIDAACGQLRMRKIQTEKST